MGRSGTIRTYSNEYDAWTARRWQRDVARLLNAGTAADVCGHGTSVEDHYNATGTAPGNKLWFEVCRQRIKRNFGFPAGSPLAWRRATVISSNLPSFATGAGSPVVNNIGLGMDAMRIPYGATVTLNTGAEQVDRAMFVVGRVNSATESICEVVDSGSGGTLATTVDGNDGTTAFPGRCNTILDTAALLGAAAARTFTVRCKVDAVKQSGVNLVGVQLLKGENGTTSGGVNGAGDFRFWNGGHFGSKIQDHLFSFNTDIDGASPGVDCGLVIIGAGMNETSASTYYTSIISLWTQIVAQCTANIPPTFVVMTPWPKTTRTPALNQDYVAAAKAACSYINGVLAPSHMWMGDCSNGKNYLGLTDDNLHPADVGHRHLGTQMGDFLSNLALAA